MKLRKRFGQFVCFLICLALFLALRMHLFSPAVTPHLFIQEKPQLPQATCMCQQHPWLACQPLVKNAEIEIERDLAKLDVLNSQITHISEEELIKFLINKLLALQATLPCCFPPELYNVLCIPEPPAPDPIAYQIYQRLYLGESEVGFPFYLDVRVYDLDDVSMDEILNWHLSSLKGVKKQLCKEPNRLTFIVKGKRDHAHQDLSHGFTDFLEERGLFLDAIQTNSKLVLCYAGAPLSTFQKYEKLFLSFIAQN